MDGAWGPWDDWSDCSLSCGGGHQFRTRLCDRPFPDAGGSLCSTNAVFSLSITEVGTLSETDTRNCNNNNCQTTTTTTTLPPKGKINYLIFPLVFIYVNTYNRKIKFVIITHGSRHGHVSLHYSPLQLMAAGAHGAIGVHVQHHVGKVEYLGLDYVTVHRHNTEDRLAI